MAAPPLPPVTTPLPTSQQDSPPKEHSLANDPEIQKSSTLNTRYVRREYVRKPYIRIAEPITCSEPKVVAGHVSKRQDKIVAVVAPPGGKKARVGGGGGKEGGEGKRNKEEGGGKSGGDGDGEGGEEPDPAGVETIDDRDESREEYESAPEDPWPDEMWNDSPPVIKCAPASAILEVEVYLGILTEEEKRNRFKRYERYRNEHRLCPMAYEYTLLSRERQVWRLEGYMFYKSKFKTTNLVEKARCVREFFEAWHNRVEIDAQMLEEAGWYWESQKQRWVTSCYILVGNLTEMDQLPVEIKRKIVLVEKWRCKYGYIQARNSQGESFRNPHGGGKTH